MYFRVKTKELKDGKYPVLGSGGTMRYVESFLYDKESILLPRKGSLSNIQYCDEPFWTVDTLYYTEINTNMCAPYYLYYYLRLLDLSRLDSGTGVPSMTFDSYYNISVSLPSLEEQKQIASVLYNLDRKIALNRAINRNLEAMAKQLYDYWFVQFDFPNAEGKPYKSSGGKMVWNETLKREIPEGWKVKRFGDVVTLKRGISYSKDNLSDCGRPMISLASFAPDSTYKVNSIKHFNGDVKASDFLAPFDILLCTTQQTEIDYKTDIVGKTIYVPDIFDESSVFTTDLVKVEVDKEIGSVILYETKKDWYNKYITGFASGTSIKHLDTKGFLSYPLAMPNDSVLHSFFKMMNTFQKRQSILLNDNIILQQQRDFLLPLLMNGQVSIK